MTARDVLPAAALLLLVTGVLAVAHLRPSGAGLFLVRLGPAGVAGLLGSRALADVDLVAIPAPGFAVLHGDAGRIRSVAGLTVAWEGGVACSAGL